MKTLTTVGGRVALGMILLSCFCQTNAQELQQVSSPPPFGTFYLLSYEIEKTPSPPYPFDPYGGSLPIYELGKGVYLVADSPEDHLKLMIEKMAMNALDGTEESESGGGGYSPLDYGPDDLWIEILSMDITNDLAF